jgi:hypothetical protein
MSLAMKTVLAILFLSALSARGQPAQIILLRHGEEPDDKAAVHLSARGDKRARALVSLLAKPPLTLTSNAPIAALFATRVTRDGRSYRTGETLAPLARETGLPVQTPFLAKDYALLARSVLTNQSFRGQTIIICWTHHNIADLAGALGADPKPPPWKEKVFDRLFVIARVDGACVWRNIPQRLLKGDSKN